MESFPPNSRKSVEAVEEKRVERVTSGSAVRRRKPLGKQFSRTFFGGDARSAVEYMITQVLIPATKEALVEAFSSGFEKLVYGEARHKRRMGSPTSGPTGYISYNRMGTPRPDDRPPMPRALARTARARHAFDDIVIPSRGEAEEVLDRMFDLVSKYDSATVADLYELTGLESSHTDHKWGWVDLRGASVGRVRGGGYLLELSEPEFLS